MDRLARKPARAIFLSHPSPTLFPLLIALVALSSSDTIEFSSTRYSDVDFTGSSNSSTMASMQKRTLIIALDLGTSTTTACFVIARHLFDAEGKPHRELCGNVCDVRDWPGSHQGDAIGNICVPTDLVYDKATGQLLFWGFDAERYLNEPFPEPHLDQVFVVEHIKLLLPDPDEAKVTTPASARYRKMRDELSATLGKHPNKVFEDFMTKVVGHVIESAKRRYNNGIHSCEVELVLAFPSGWPDYIHTTVAGIGAKAMSKAISKGHLQNMTFGIENVYTVSETLSGVKEWLRDSIAEATLSVDLDQPTVINLNELNVSGQGGHVSERLG